MATEDFSSSDFQPSAPLFQPYKGFPPALTHAKLPGHMLASFATSVRQIAGGCQVIVDLLQHEQLDDIDRDEADPHCTPRMLGDFHRGQLQVLVSACLESLTQRSAELLDHAYAMHTDEGRQEALARMQSRQAAQTP